MVFLSWLVRYGHVLFAATWVGGYALLAFFIIPLIEKGESRVSPTHRDGEDVGETLAVSPLVRLAITTVRFLTYAGTVTIGFGIVLITRTNGFSNLFGSAWGGFIIAAFVIAIVLLGIGDGALRPAILKIKKTGGTSARRWAITGFVLTVIAVGVMTGATFVG